MITSETIDRIKQRLAELRLSSFEASRQAGLDRNFLNDLFVGRKRTITTENAAKIAPVLKASVQWIMAGDDGVPGAVGDVVAAGLAFPAATQMAKNIPIMGTAAGSLRGSFRISDGPVDWARRPPGLEGARDIYGIYVTGESMSPKYEQGELCLVNPHRPCRIGDTVIIQIQYNEHDGIEAYIKIFVGYADGKVVVRQLNPAATIDFKKQFVVAMHHVVTTAEMIGL